MTNVDIQAFTYLNCEKSRYRFFESIIHSFHRDLDNFTPNIYRESPDAHLPDNDVLVGIKRKSH
jgi:hypothetical protein